VPSRIVEALDTSEVAESAVPLARALAQSRNLPVTLVSVVDGPTEFFAWASDKNFVDELLRRQEERREYLERIAGQLAGLPVDVATLSGHAANELVSYINALDDPLLVMTSHGRTGLRRVMMGSVVARVLHGVTHPVVVSRASSPDHPIEITGNITKVVVPLDGSHFAEHALITAENTLSDPAVEFHLVRVPEQVYWQSSAYGVADYEAIEMYMDAAQQESQTYLEAMADDLTKRGRKVTWEVRTGLIADVILEAAKETSANLIAMASHGRSGFTRFVMGSVAERVLHDSPVPVLMVGPKDADVEADAAVAEESK
jgi:nucleotide-binding universal stress UspA family protein